MPALFAGVCQPKDPPFTVFGIAMPAGFGDQVGFDDLPRTYLGGDARGSGYYCPFASRRLRLLRASGQSNGY